MTTLFGIVFLVIAVILTLVSFQYDWLSSITVFFWALAAACIILGGVDKRSQVR